MATYYNDFMNSFLFGQSENGLAIDANIFGDRGKHVFILGGVHGDEVEGIALAKALVADFYNSFDFQLKVTIVSCLNIDGLLAGTRQNANGVDLNRNLPTKDWSQDAFNDRYNPGNNANSEKENNFLVNFIEKEHVDFILSLHSFSKTLINVNGACSPVDQILNEITGLPIEQSIGYPTPGCLGTFAGLERNIPTITYELLRGSEMGGLIDMHGSAIKKAISIFASTYR